MSWHNASQRTQEKQAKNLSDRNPNGLLFHSLIKNSKTSRKSIIPILHRITTPGSGRKVTKLLNNVEKKTPIMMSPEFALALFNSCGLSQDDYQKIKNATKNLNVNIFPSYHRVR